MPVDIASGIVHLDYEDITIPGKVALIWERRYSTALVDQPPSALGLGWSCRYFSTLTKRPDGYEFRTPNGAIEIFPDYNNDVEKGRVIRNFGAFLEIFKTRQHYVVQSWDIETGEIIRYCFLPGQPGDSWLLNSIENVSGEGLDLKWNHQQKLLSIQQRLEQRKLILGYNSKGLINNVTLQAPSSEQHLLTRYNYDTIYRQIAAYDAAGSADYYEYNEQHRLTREIVKDGGVFSYRYDEKGRCVRTTGLDRYQEKHLRFLDAINFTEVTDSYNRTLRFQYLPSGQIVREIDPHGNEKITDYDEHGRIIAKTDATGAVTRHIYDDSGNRATTTDALGNTHSFTYNDHHLVVSMTDPLGQVWRRDYDSANRPIATMDPLGNRWRITYDIQGNMAELQNPLGTRKCYRYIHGILSEITDWMGNTTRFQFDSLGRIIKRIGALNEETCFYYDLLGNPIEVTLPDGTLLHATYDNVSNLTSFTDGNGHITRFRYGPCKRLLERIDPVDGVIRHVWGSEPGRLEQIINEKGETYTFFYNEVGRIIREQSFDGTDRMFQYDAEGYLSSYINANGETISIQRDALHRVIGLILPDDEEVSYTFNPLGNLIGATNSDTAVTFERDPWGRILREEQGNYWVDSRYDALGNLVHTATSLGHAVNYEVDANGFVSQLAMPGNYSINFKRNAYGQEIIRQMPGRVTMEQRYDNLGRLIEQRIGPGHLKNDNAPIIPANHEFIRRHYNYDPNGSLTSIGDSRWGHIDYIYDPAERLLNTVHQQGVSESFSYDATGNIIRLKTQEKQENIQETLIYGPGNKLLQKDNTRYEYDAEGRRIRMIEEVNSDNPKVWLYQWNALDRLKAVTLPNGDVWKYQYDALGRRVKKTGPDKKSLQFLWDKNVVIHEMEGTKSLSAWIFDKFNPVPLATVQNNCVYSIINNQLGTPREIIDSNGKIIGRINHNSWGRSFIHFNKNSEKINCPIRFPGQWSDGESKLHYNRFRYYDFKIGQYISADPIGLNGGWNQYLYAKNPIRYLDSRGLACHTEDQQAVLQLADEARKTGGLSDANATSLLTWAHEANADATTVGAPQIKVLDHRFSSGNNPPPGHFAHEGSQGHVHIGSGHIPVN